MKYALIALSTVLLAILLIGTHISNNSMGLDISTMISTCEQSYKVNAQAEDQHKMPPKPELNKQCGNDILAVQRGNYYQVMSDGHGIYWAEYQGKSVN